MFRLKANQLPSMDVIVLVQEETRDQVLKISLDSGFSELMKFEVH